ncbi:MAG: CDP-diacylglycerol--glycerol-3-phosphate 3-phosphatidyltransferase [Propionicimonas sp.]|uniref:CDP-diacylglycerol--glycerol-3-phosphate 3-phosphatidyltransferase n=1 Tax=Propionicimonas sp. TaxID=1955623 RepID=UPI002B1EAF21|nr:CDP-diacylglycerol--glycerol-3-phosphate 3-phosphatidyltransferase [Propionicimonas sp.]MEA4943706.1 CDP-diacylglycerol--glycerol-3-phosphate 3-phosphatidyltransferase [Propionicimonas sp.]MEA5052863.1 CDP-diacylglycerol--glycerol-3-phosphate 3-phosphatidyltransferase [Propionicimonas sp.]
MAATSPTPTAGIPAWLPNSLTILRLILVPVFVVVLFVAPTSLPWRLAASATFLVAILTDLFDGRLARKYNLVSDFGKIWDPIADKALTGAAFIGLSVLGELPWWITILILAREWGITWMRVRMLKYEVMAAAPGGKLKTVLQSIALVMFLAYPIQLTQQPAPWWFWPAWVVMAAAFVMTLVTGVQYVVDAWRLRAKALAATGDDSQS